MSEVSGYWKGPSWESVKSNGCNVLYTKNAIFKKSWGFKSYAFLYTIPFSVSKAISILYALESGYDKYGLNPYDIKFSDFERTVTSPISVFIYVNIYALSLVLGNTWL